MRYERRRTVEEQLATAVARARMHDAADTLAAQVKRIANLAAKLKESGELKAKKAARDATGEGVEE